MTDPASWRRCSVCKEPIALGALYWVCSVSTCNRSRTALYFCTVSCWDSHLPVARHREAWAEERRAPRTPDAAEPAAPASAQSARSAESAQSKAPSAAAAMKREKRRIIPSTPAPSNASAGTSSAGSDSDEVLIVASRLKDFVRAESGFNTSDRALGPLSDIVRTAVREAIENASRDGRKTVLDRDVPRR